VGAKLWIFAEDGSSSTALTSPDGSSWIASRPRTVLAQDQSGQRYGYVDLGYIEAPPAPAPARYERQMNELEELGYIDSAPAGFDDFLNNKAAIQADAL
jgi:hypothetical protein